MSEKMKVVYKNIDDLIPYVNNTRTHSEHQVEQIASSIKEFGFTNPILVDEDGGVIAGHGRIMAARKLHLGAIPTVQLEGLTPAQKKAYIIADNKIALNAGWDDRILKLEMKTLEELNFDATLTGFEQGEITNLFLDIEEGKTDPDEEWVGMPEFEQEDANSFRKIIVHFECESDAQEFARLLGQEITDKTKSIWHPKKERNDLKNTFYGE